MRPLRWHMTAFNRVDWGRLTEHLTAGLMIAVGAAMVANPDGAIWPVVYPALKLWFGGALVYAGGFIQNAEKLPAGESSEEAK